jgi:hypothetical protein
MQHHLLVVVYIYQEYLLMEIQKQDEQNLGIIFYLINRKKTKLKDFLLLEYG